VTLCYEGFPPQVSPNSHPSSQLQIHPNDVLRFALELCMLAAPGYGGYEAGSSPVNYLLMVALPLAAASIWGVFLAPKARRPLADPLRIGLEVILFGAAGAALATADQLLLAAILWLVAAIHLALTFALRQRPPDLRRGSSMRDSV
jgi:hypothetical protein